MIGGCFSNFRASCSRAARAAWGAAAGVESIIRLPIILQEQGKCCVFLLGLPLRCNKVIYDMLIADP